MSKVLEILSKLYQTKVIGSIFIVLVCFLIYKALTFFLSAGEAKTKLFTSKKSKTYVKLLKNAIRFLFVVVTILLVLQFNGINVKSILAGVGIFGVIFGLAIQDWLKDIIRGSSIISDSYFEVGDIVKFGDIEGKVLVIGLQTTKIQDLKNDNIIAIANRRIEQIEVVSKLLYLKVPVPYEVKLEDAEKAMEDIVKLIKKNDNTYDCKYVGVTDLDSSCVQYFLKLEINQAHKLQARRDAIRSIMLGLDKHNIEVPYTQIDIHNK